MSREEFKRIFNNNFIQQSSLQLLHKLIPFRINLEKVHPLNKPGNFGRVLERKCKFVHKGVLQYQQGKEAKLKQVKSFINKIQYVQNKDLADLSWLNSEAEKFKFRIILLDTNQNKKGVYFQTFQQAQTTRAYLVFRYKKTSISRQVFEALKYRMLEKCVLEIVDQIKHKSLMQRVRLQQTKEKERIQNSNLSQANLESRKLKNDNPAEKSKQEPLSGTIGTIGTIKIPQQPKQSLMNDFLDDLINKHIQQKSFQSQSNFEIKFSEKSGSGIATNFTSLNNLYRIKFFSQWRKSTLGADRQIQSGQPKLPFRKYIDSNVWKEGRLEQKSIEDKLHRREIEFTTDQLNKPTETLQNPAYLPSYRENLNSQSPIKQFSRINKILSHSKKQQSVFTHPENILDETGEAEKKMMKKSGTEKITFKSIEFFKTLIKDYSSNQNQSRQHSNKNLLRQQFLIKPIVAINVYKRKPQQTDSKFKVRQSIDKENGSLLIQKQKEYIFNTTIKNIGQNSEYQLTSTDGDGVFETNQNMKHLFLIVSVTNFITNQEILECEVSFQNFCFDLLANSIVDTSSTIRLKFEYKNAGIASPEAIYKNSRSSESSLFLCFPKIDPQIINKIKTYWQSEAVSNSYYSLEDNFNLFDAVTNSSNKTEPLNWWIDLEETEYNYLCVLQSSSFILGYKLVKPMLFIIRAVKNVQLKIQKIVEILLSVILNLGKSYYFPEQITKVNYLHREVGLSKGSITFENRVLLEVLLFENFFSFECPSLQQKFRGKNISISHLMLEYSFELFSRNFNIQILCQLWNYCSQQVSKIPLIFFLITIALCRLFTERLIKCNRLSQIREVFQSKNIRSYNILHHEVKHLRQKYFSKGQGLFEQIKYAFQQKPFESVLKLYHKQIAQKQEFQKKDKTKYKKKLTQKLQQCLGSEEALEIFSKKEQYKYILHIYFYQLPESIGKMVLSSGKNDYQSIGSEKNKYFIIGELTEPVIIKCTDWKGLIYSGELVFSLGFNEFKIQIHTEKKEETSTVHYLCGLLTQTQIQIIKSNKKFSHFMGPNVTIDLFKDQLLRMCKQLKYTQDWMSEHWFKDLRTIFSHGNKMFNEVDYFLCLLGSQRLTVEEKLAKLRQYSLQLSRQFLFCHNQIVYKHLLHEFFKTTFISLKQQDFVCYFNDALQNQFDAPKIFKCRFYCDSKEIKLEKEITEYHAKKAKTHLYGDLFIDQIVSFCQKHVKTKTTINFTQAELKILYSTFGIVSLKVLPIKVQNKQFMIDRQKYIDQHSIFHDLSQKEPQILMTQILPSFSKISTILDYVNSNRTIDLRAKTNFIDRKILPEQINLLKFAQKKFRNCLLLRYKKYPANVQIPFYSYFIELTTEFNKPTFKSYYMNNVKDSIKSVCTSKDHLKFGSNNKQQEKDFDKSLGLYGNLRKILKSSGENKGNTVFFWTHHKDQIFVPSSLVCINYGYGIIRWEKCVIQKYRKKVKKRLEKREPQNQVKKKIQYLVEKEYNTSFKRQYEVKLNPLVKDLLKDDSLQQAEAKFKDISNDIKQGFNFLLNPNSLNDFLKSIKRN